MLLLFFCTFCDCKPTLIPYQELSKLLPKGSVDVNFDSYKSMLYLVA